jgi:hypothetical protein
MPHLAYYEQSTGLIQGVWSAVLAEHLTPQIETDHPTHAYLLVDDDTLSPALLQERYWVQNGVLTLATERTLLAVPNPFVADGVAECTIRPQPFVPCTLLVEALGTQTAVALTADDDPLLLTAAVPQVFTVALAPLAGSWATPIAVEAT